MFRRGTALIGVVITTMLTSGCTPTGDSFAASLAERVIIGIGDDITPPYPKPKDAERLAAEAIAHPRLPHLEAPVDYGIDVLGWEGHSGDTDGARIEIRVDVFVHNSSARSVGGASYAEGKSVRCWELTVFGFHDHDSLKTKELSCPADAVALTPLPAPLPALPDDTDARLLAAVEGATFENVDERVQQRFADAFYTVTSAEHEGELIVALGIPSEEECVVAVRHVDNSIEILRGWQKVLITQGKRDAIPISTYGQPLRTEQRSLYSSSDPIGSSTVKTPPPTSVAY
ncbi:MAG: hypothetical protein ACOH19_16890 [Rhodoglobus sp.]